MEWVAFEVIKKFYYNADLKADFFPIWEFDKNLSKHIRRNAYYHNFGFKISSQVPYQAQIFFDDTEGMLRHGAGDMTFSKWGYKGPFFKKEKPENIFRIITLGGSTTQGIWASELNYPRILERILNNKLNTKIHYQVINMGMVSFSSCQIKTILAKEAMAFNPDLLLIMSGTNDLVKISKPKIHENLEDYCKFSHSFLDRFHVYRLLKNHYLKYRFLKNKIKTPNYSKKTKVIKNSLQFYRENLKEIILQAQTKKVPVGLLTTTTVIDNINSIQTQKTIPQLRTLELALIEFYREGLIEIEKIQKNLAKDLPNAFHIEHSLSINTEKKEIYFEDAHHPTGSGYKILAYNIYKTLNQKFKIHPKVNFVNRRQINKNHFELLFLESIFATNMIEDLSYTGCIAFHESCIHLKQKKSNQKKRFVTNIVDFSLGMILRFPNEIKNSPKLYYFLESLLLKSTQIRPDFSLNYWVLGQLYTLKNESKHAGQKLIQSYELDPLLKNLSFQKEKERFKNIRNSNPLLDLNLFIETIKHAPRYISAYVYFRGINTMRSESIPENINLYNRVYYSNPILIRSIYEHAVQYLVSNKKYNLALKLIAKLKSLKPEYLLNDTFSKYEKEILKME
jgi:lysophospholipase L1-like esterase